MRPDASGDGDPRESLFRMIYGGWLSQALAVAGHLRLIDLIESGLQSSSSLAAEAGCHEPSLRRLLDYLVAHEVLTTNDGRYLNTELSLLLGDQHPQSLRVFAAGQIEAPFQYVLETVMTGQSALELQHGQSYFDYLESHPEVASEFDIANAEATRRVSQSLVDAIDFSGYRTFVDIGGGSGELAAAILSSNSHLRGVVFDSPRLREACTERLLAENLSERGTFASGSFFESVPEAMDCYLLKHVLHDWRDSDCKSILSTIRAAMAEHSQLLVVESLRDPQTGATGANATDLEMMVTVGGRERSKAELEALLKSSGLEVIDLIPTEFTPVVIRSRIA